MNQCACGCGRTVSGDWSKGHNRRGVPPTNKRGYTKTAAGYRFVYQPQHAGANPTGYIAEHRLIVERRIGRCLRPDEDVHHRNGDKGDNDPANLELLTHAAHARLTVLVAEQCFECGRRHRARGLCSRCYGVYYRQGWEMPLPPSRRNRWTANT